MSIKNRLRDILTEEIEVKGINGKDSGDKIEGSCRRKILKVAGIKDNVIINR
jgi:hypothetical protein